MAPVHPLAIESSIEIDNYVQIWKWGCVIIQTQLSSANLVIVHAESLDLSATAQTNIPETEHP